LVKRKADHFKDRSPEDLKQELAEILNLVETKRRRKHMLKCAKNDYNKAKTELACKKSNLLAAFESSEESTL